MNTSKVRVVAAGRRFRNEQGQRVGSVSVDPSWALESACASCTPHQQRQGCVEREAWRLEEAKHGRR